MGGFERTGHIRTPASIREPILDVSATLIEGEQTARPNLDTRIAARSMGYTGDVCSNCGSMQMQMAGHCQVCASCGTTTGCS